MMVVFVICFARNLSRKLRVTSSRATRRGENRVFGRALHSLPMACSELYAYHFCSYDTVVMFADVSGFTALSEAMAKYGPEGAEYLAKHLNSYFGQMVKAIASEGGDIFKFAGDAMIVLWPDLDTMEARARRAAQCALAIQEALHAAELSEGVTLSVKIGIGMGRVSVLHLGGVLNRMEYVAVGDPLVQAFNAEGHAEAGGATIVSPQLWKVINPYVNALEVFSDGFARLTKHGKGISPEASEGLGAIKKREKRVNKTRMMKDLGLDSLDSIPGLEKILKCYLPGAILPWVSPESADLESWGGDLRNATVMFVNLGLKEHDLLAAAHYEDAMIRAHNVLMAVQSAVYQYEGAVNKFLMDDKGSTLIAVWGLPPLSHEDDPTRGVLCGLAICERLWELGLVASCGITTGVVFCGVVGSTTRKEYSVLGDTVNLSARLMQRAYKQGGGVICDRQVRLLAQQGLEFKDEGEISVKGKSHKINIFKPYPADVAGKMPPTNAPGSEPKMYRQAYETQVFNYHSYATLRPHHVSPIPALSSPGDQQATEIVAAATAAGAAAASANPNRASARLPGRRTTKMLNALGGSGGTGAAADIVGGLSEGPLDPAVVSREPPCALSQSRTTVLLDGEPAGYSASTVPTVEQLKLAVPTGMQEDAWLLKDLDYSAVQSETLDVDIGSDPTTTMAQARDRAVQAAKDAGYLPKSADANELRLQVDGSSAILPASPLPILWMGVFISEVTAVDPLKFNGTLSVMLCKARDEPVLMPRHFAARQSMMEGKMNLFASKQGGTVLLEGAMGTGKTWLLRQFVGLVMPGKTSMFCANGSPFTRTNPFAVWGALLRQFVDLYGATNSISSRTSVTQQLLQKFAPDRRLLPLASLLNACLTVNLPDSAALDKLTMSQKQSATSALLMVLLRAMVGVARLPVTLVIDDAMYMHEASWDLALHLAAVCSAPVGTTDSLPLLLVIAARTPRPYCDVIMPTVPSSYTALLQAPFVKSVRISRLPRWHARAMVQSSLQWHGSIDDSLHTLVEGRAQGNPLMIQEVMLSLVNKGRLMVVADPQDRLVVQRMQLGTALVPFYGLDLVGAASKTTPRSGGRRASFQGHLLQSKSGLKLGLGGKLQLVAGVATPVPFCHKVTSNLGMQVDRLPTLEQMVLKVGSVIADAKQKEEIAKLGESGSSGTSIAAKRIFDHRFKFSVLFEVFPLKEVKDLLGELCASLEDRGFIIRTLAATTGKGGPSSNTVSLRNINLGDAAPATAAAGSEAASKEPIFEFTHSFVSDTVRLRVLAEQRKQLEKGIQDCFRRQAELLRRIYVTKVMETKGSAGQPDKAGTLNVRKNVPGSSKKQGVFSFGTVKSEWKSRYVSIKADNLAMYRDEHEEKSGQDPVQSIPLSASTATLLPGSQDLKHEHVFRVDASHYIKKGQLVQESRSFYMAAEGKEEADDWVFWISFMRDKLAASGASLTKGISGPADEDDATAAARRLVEYGSESAYAIAAERGVIFPRTRLLVTVEEGADLPPAKQTGHTSPYVTLQVGRAEKRVNPVLLSRNPHWLSTVALAVTPAVAAEGVLRVQVWDKDKYAADSLIGVVEVPLVDVAIHAPPPRPKLDEWLAHWGEEGGGAAADDVEDEGYDSEEGEEEEEKEAYLEAARAETEAQATVEPQTFALVAPDVLQRATVAQIQANGGDWRLPLSYDTIMVAAQAEDVNRGTVALRLRLVAEGDDWGAIEAARSSFREGATSAVAASDDSTAHHSLAARALFLLGRADLSWLSSMDMSASTGHAQGMGVEDGVGGGDGGTVDVPALLGRLQHLNDMLTGMQNTGAATLTKDAISSLRKGLDQSMLAIKGGSGGGGGGSGSSEDANQRAIADGVGGSSAAGATSFIHMVSLLDLDETNREWLASQYSKADSESISSSRGSMTSVGSSPRARSSRQSTAVRNMRRSSAIVISPGDATTHTAIRRLSRSSLKGLTAVSEDEVQVEMDTAWGEDAPPAMDAHDLHAQRCLQVPGYLTLGASHLSYVQTWGRYGWGIQALKHSENEEPDEGELAAAAVRGDEGGGYYTDLMEQLTYEDTEDNVQGPFPARDIFEWHEEGYMPDDMMIRCGAAEDGSSMVLLQDIISGLAVRAHLSRLRELTYEAETEQGATDVDIDAWDFNMFSLQLEHPVHAIPVASYVFASLRLPKFFAIREDSFVAFLADVCDRMCLYPDSTPYHNYWHVTDVMHTVYIMLTRFRAGALLSPSEILGLVVAALCHDLEHPGLGNSYQVNAQTELALRYNDTSVLESHHAALASVVVRDSTLFGGLLPHVGRAARKVMLSAILATDMTCHFGLTSDLRGVAERHVKRMQYLTGASRVAKVCTAAELAAHGSHYGIEGTDTRPAEGYELAASIPAADREIVYKTLLHAAGISNPAKSWALCRLWSDRVVDEFFQQGDREKAEELPVSPNMDRDNTNQAKMSLNFIDFIVAPLFVAMTTLLPPMQEACDSLAANRANWESIVHTDLDAAGGGGADTERRQWKRRQTAFQQVLMPLSKLGGGSGSDASRAMALSGLQTFVAANVVAEEDEGAANGSA